MSIRLIMMCLVLTHCAPVIVGGSAAMLGGMVYREKGISGTLDDTSLAFKVRNNLRKRDLDWHTHIAKKVSVCVQNGEALLTGSVDTNEEALWAEQATWEVFGIKGVVNQLKIGHHPQAGSACKDAWITAKCKSMILTHSQITIRGLNYVIKTVDGVVYVMGVSRSVREQQIVLNTIARVKGVKKVVCLARFKEEILT